MEDVNVTVYFCVENVGVVLRNNHKRPDNRYLGTRELLPRIRACQCTIMYVSMSYFRAEQLIIRDSEVGNFCY